MKTRFLIVPPNVEIALGIAKVVELTREQAVRLIHDNTKFMPWKEAETMGDKRINALLPEAYERQKARDAKVAA